MDGAMRCKSGSSVILAIAAAYGLIIIVGIIVTAHHLIQTH
jgi:hypothetical protein